MGNERANMAKETMVKEKGKEGKVYWGTRLCEW
jgi:hypothetical protein